ncbi:hypothetical protein OKW40_002486 [Paraburkholderia sp. RAU6.4a]|uniref:hypothetical protein n=1 Tax=Paraburkholderia sp. RAU6.4a TaxID=2991067 RepID=UPI003D1BD4FA
MQGTEQQSGLVIQVEVDPARGATVACHVDERGATLLVSRQEFFQPAPVMHELLHMRRFLVDGVPQIVVNEDYNDWTPELERGLTNLDNGLEHLVIVPEEILRFPVRRQYWAGVMARKLEEIRVNPLNPDDRRRHALVNWLFIHHVLMDEAQRQAADSLLSFGRTGAATTGLRFSRRHYSRACREGGNRPALFGAVEHTVRHSCPEIHRQPCAAVASGSTGAGDINPQGGHELWHAICGPDELCRPRHPSFCFAGRIVLRDALVYGATQATLA